MSMLDTAKQFFEACESGKGWAGCEAFCHEGATFRCQADALAETTTLEAYSEWMKGLLGPIPDGRYELMAFAADAKLRHVTYLLAVGFLAVARNVGEWVAEQEYKGLEWIRGSNTFYTVVARVGALMVPTVAASVSRILGFGILRGLMRRTSIIENNINQTVASAVNGASSGMSTEVRGHAWVGDRTVEKLKMIITTDGTDA